MSARHTTYIALGLFAVAVAGLRFGVWSGHPGHAPNLYTTMGMASLALYVYEAVGARHLGTRGRRAAGMTGAALAALLCAVVMAIDPFVFFPRNVEGLAETGPWLAAVCVAGVAFARCGMWYGAAGAGLFLFACAALVGFNAHAADKVGFVSIIM